MYYNPITGIVKPSIRKGDKAMTDNEKRAHDFAIALLPIALPQVAKHLPVGESGQVNVDAFRTYMATYTLVLDSFNREFPHGQ